MSKQQEERRPTTLKTIVVNGVTYVFNSSPSVQSMIRLIFLNLILCFKGLSNAPMISQNRPVHRGPVKRPMATTFVSENSGISNITNV